MLDLTNYSVSTWPGAENLCYMTGIFLYYASQLKLNLSTTAGLKELGYVKTIYCSTRRGT